MPAIRRGSADDVFRAQMLRRDKSYSETLLWACLRAKRLYGLKFRQQAPVMGFAVDFYCPQWKLVVELDGRWHRHQRERDAMRDRHLEGVGLRVLRLKAYRVFADLPAVLQEILLEVGLPGRVLPVDEDGVPLVRYLPGLIWPVCPDCGGRYLRPLEGVVVADDEVFLYEVKKWRWRPNRIYIDEQQVSLRLPHEGFPWKPCPSCHGRPPPS